MKTLITREMALSKLTLAEKLEMVGGGRNAFEFEVTRWNDNFRIMMENFKEDREPRKYSRGHTPKRYRKLGTGRGR